MKSLLKSGIFLQIGTNRVQKAGDGLSIERLASPSVICFIAIREPALCVRPFPVNASVPA